MWAEPSAVARVNCCAHDYSCSVTVAHCTARIAVALQMQNYQRLNYLYDKYHARGLEVSCMPAVACLHTTAADYVTPTKQLISGLTHLRLRRFWHFRVTSLVGWSPAAMRRSGPLCATLITPPSRFSQRCRTSCLPVGTVVPFDNMLQLGGSSQAPCTWLVCMCGVIDCEAARGASMTCAGGCERAECSPSLALPVGPSAPEPWLPSNARLELQQVSVLHPRHI
jgi:hypothetical protein